LEFYLFYIPCSSITEGVGTKYTNETRDGIKSGSFWAHPSMILESILVKELFMLLKMELRHIAEK